MHPLLGRANLLVSCCEEVLLCLLQVAFIIDFHRQWQAGCLWQHQRLALSLAGAVMLPATPSRPHSLAHLALCLCPCAVISLVPGHAGPESPLSLPDAWCCSS